MKRIYFFFFIILLASASCGKLRKEVISGVLIDDSTKVTLSGVEVNLYSYHDYSISNAELRKSTTTDSKGNFKISYNLRNREGPYALSIIKSGYYWNWYKIDEATNLEAIVIRLVNQ
ncbi:hypothetical protein BH10BAC1_BH10BAC1_00650 [soil metagenome]